MILNFTSSCFYLSIVGIRDKREWSSSWDVKGRTYGGRQGRKTSQRWGGTQYGEVAIRTEWHDSSVWKCHKRKTKRCGSWGWEPLLWFKWGLGTWIWTWKLAWVIVCYEVACWMVQWDHCAPGNSLVTMLRPNVCSPWKLRTRVYDGRFRTRW